MTTQPTPSSIPPTATASGAAQGSFRQAMAWLHTWCGLWFSWLLYAVFLTGTLAVFEAPLTHWMSPEHALEEAQAAAAPTPAPPFDMAQRLAWATGFMAANQPQADMWELWPGRPGGDEEGGRLVAYWFDAAGGYASQALDPLTGQPLAPPAGPPERATLGGHHFVNFHYELHAGNTGLWIIGFAAMAMLVALVSGIVIHKRIFKDFFTFRPRKGQRSWLDAHNAVAVLSLPFLFMIVYTGLVISGLRLMPAATLAQGGGVPSSLQQELGDPARPARSGQALAVPHLAPLVARAEAMIGQQVRAVVVDHPGDRAMRIAVYGWNGEGALHSRLSSTTGMVSFSAATGEVLHVRPPGGVEGGVPHLVQQVMLDLHMAGFGGRVVKWLYFVGGLAGTAMMATGAILFMVKRRGKHGREFGAGTARVYRLVEGLNIAAIAGLAVACVAYLWANRLLPLRMEARATAELWVFFGVWALALVHAFVCSPARAWVAQLAMLAALCLLLPLLNAATFGDQLVAQITRGDWESAGVELTALGFGAAAWWASRQLGRRARAAVSPRVRG